MALVGIELETLVSEPDALTTRPAQRLDLGCTACAGLCITLQKPASEIYLVIKFFTCGT